MKVVNHRHLADDACAELVLGLASGPAAAEAGAHVRDCPACEARLRAHAGADLHARAARRAGLHVPGPRRRGIDWRLPAVAAAAIVAAVLWLRAPAPAPQGPAWLTRPDHLVRTRAAAPLDDALRSGFDAYARHDLPAAIAALERARASGGAEQARRLYLGHALLASGRAAEARAWLESVDLDVLPEPWRGEAERSLAAAWRRTGDGRRADSLERARRR